MAPSCVRSHTECSTRSWLSMSSVGAARLPRASLTLPLAPLFTRVKQEAHFRTAHFPCPHPDCLTQKFVVFESELDLQAHAVEVHGASLADQRTRKDARRIETNFTYQQVENNRRGGGAGAARGGGGGGGHANAGRNPRVEEPVAGFVRTEEESNTRGAGRVVPGLGAAVPGASRRAGFGAGLTLDQPPHRVNGAAGGSGASTPRGDPQVQECV